MHHPKNQGPIYLKWINDPDCRGKSDRYCAMKLGCTESYIQKLRLRHGIKYQGFKRIEFPDTMQTRYILKAKPVREAAKLLGCNASTISRHKNRKA